MTTPPLPKPFTNLPCAGSVTTSIAVWASDAIEAYATAAVQAALAQQRQPLDYFRVQEIAQARRIGYNELSAALRDYLDIAAAS